MDAQNLVCSEGLVNWRHTFCMLRNSPQSKVMLAYSLPLTKNEAFDGAWGSDLARVLVQARLHQTVFWARRLADRCSLGVGLGSLGP